MRKDIEFVIIAISSKKKYLSVTKITLKSCSTTMLSARATCHYASRLSQMISNFKRASFVDVGGRGGGKEGDKVLIESHVNLVQIFIDFEVKWRNQSSMLLYPHFEYREHW